MRVLALALASTLAPACVPMYLPPGANLTMQERRGDMHLGAGVGFEGYHLRGGFALTDRIGLRSEAIADDSPYGSYRRFGQLGGSYTFASGGEKPDAFPSGLRAGGALDVGYGASRSGFDIRLGSTTSRFVYATHLFRVAPEGFIGYESRYLAAGIALRLALVGFKEAPGNEDADPQSFYAFGEPTAVIRFGAEAVKLDFQLDLSIPVAGGGTIGGFWPFTFSLGVVTDFNLAPSPKPAQAPAEAPPPA